MSQCVLSLAEIADQIGAELHGDSDYKVESLASLAFAGPGQLSYCIGPNFKDSLSASKAGAVILPADCLEYCPSNALVVAKPELAFALLTNIFNDAPKASGQIHAKASVDDKAELGKNVTVDAMAVIAAGAKIGDGAHIGSGSFVSEDVVIGANTQLHANVTLYHKVELGSDCIIHSGTVIGADGFGFSPGPQGLEKLYQLGTVKIGDRVEIGANCCIDRGALEDTVIADGVKMDNLIHIAHNVEIGENTAMAGCVGVAGSAKIGKNCQFGGMVGINGHIHIVDNVTATGMTFVAQSIKEPGIYSGNLPASENKVWLKNITRFRQLDGLFKRVRNLEKS